MLIAASVSRSAAGILLAAAPMALASAQSSRDTTVLRPVVVTASAAPVAPSDAPATVTVITGESLRQRGVTHLADALRTVPGLAVVPGGSMGATTSLFVRGGNSNFVKVLVDGVPVNAPGGAIDLAHLTVDDVERIEVVRGPTSVVYGSDAMSGVVQIVTRRGTPAPRGSLSLRAGTFGTREASADASGGTTSLGWSLAGASRRTDGILAFNNAYRNQTGAGSLRFARGATEARATVRVIDARFHYPTDGSGQLVDSNAVRDETRTIVGATLDHRFATRAAARLELTSSDVTARSTDDPDSPADTSGFSHDRSHIARRGADARLSLDLARDARLTLGGSLEGQRVSDQGESQYMRFDPTSSSFRERRTTRAAYAELLGSGERRFTYALGARLDDNSAYGSFGTGRLAVGLRLGPATRLRGAFGTAFREPAFDEAFSTAYTIGNRSLVPERTRSWEAGIDQTAFDDRLQLGARWFDQRFRDLIQYISGTAETDFLGTYGNLAAANASGLELEARAPRLGRFDAAASATLLRTEVVDAGNGAFGVFAAGERLLRRPSRQASLELGARASRDLTLRGTLQLVGARDDYDFALGHRVELPAYGRVDVAGEYRVAASDVAITARVENVLDARYEPVLHFRAPGRALLLGVRLGR